MNIAIKKAKKTIKNISSTAFIAITSYKQTSVKRKARMLGFDDFILKPLTIEHCKDFLNKFFHKKNNQD